MGPVQVIPVDSARELQITLAAADEWNAGQFVEPYGRAAFLAGDRLPANQDYGINPSLVEKLDEVASTYTARGYPHFPILRLSNYPPGGAPNNTQAASVGTINAGIRDLWVSGMSIHSGDWAGFMHGEPYPYSALTKKQRIMVFAPSCMTAAVQLPEEVWGQPSIAEKLLFNDPEGTVAAGVVGQLNGDWGANHRLFQNILSTKLAEAPDGRPMARIVYDAVREMQTFKLEYGRGVVFLGAHVINQSGPPAPTAIELGSAASHVTVRVEGNPTSEGLAIVLGLSTKSAVYSDVFDVTGRRVSGLTDKQFEAGKHRITWNGKNDANHKVAPGVYFIRIAVNGQERSVRAVVVP